jgi:hypothetical protein
VDAAAIGGLDMCVFGTLSGSEQLFNKKYRPINPIVPVKLRIVSSPCFLHSGHQINVRGYAMMMPKVLTVLD